MKNPFSILSFFKSKRISFLFLSLISISVFSQVGIGTLNADASSALDVSSESLGILVPRMTTLERTDITDPANSLLVFDTDERSFFYYDSIPPNPKWIRFSSDLEKRNKHVLVKSVADLPAPSGGKITLLADHLYEINGTINLVVPIDLNNATVAGRDGYEDILRYPSGTGGTVFQGSTGGTIKNVTLKGGRAFNITGPGKDTNTSLIVQNVVIDGLVGSSVGTISGLGLYFGNIIQYMNNTNGIVYSNIGNLLLNNQGWFDTNKGTYETYTGTFGLIEKVSGFSTVSGSAIAMDFNSNPTVGTGVLLGHVFSGANVTNSIKKYTTGSYSGYNFTNAWTVDSPGIPRESDGVATGDINFLGTLTGADGYTTSFNGNPPREKVWGVTTSKNLYRFTRDGDNRITYRGAKNRIFQVNASISYQLTTTNTEVMLYFAKNGVTLEDTKIYARVGDTNEIEASKILGTIEMKQGDYIEIYAERVAGSGKMFTVSLNLSAK